MRQPARISLLLLFLFSAATIAFSQSVSDRPERGEGIWSMLRRNGVEPTPQSVSEFKRLNSSRLGNGETLKTGVSYTLPVDADIHPIFGPKYEKVVRKSDRLKDHVYYVVAGHGGPDPGTVGTYNGKRISEDEVAYDTALRFARRLTEEGATVYCIVQDTDGIRDTEHLASNSSETYLGGVPIVLNQKKRLEDRARIINDLYDKHKKTAKVQRVISLHVDAVGSKVEPPIDVHFIYASSDGKDLSRAMFASIQDKYDTYQPGRGYRGKIESRDLMILRDTKPVAVLVELGNIRHKRDQVRLMKPSNRQALANWMVEGILSQASRIRA